MLKYINEKTNTQEDFVYACARVRGLEKRLLNREILEKMIESQNLEDCLKILTENYPNEYVFDSLSPADVDNSLIRVLKETIGLIKEISPYPYLFKLFNLKYDFYNIKILLKSKLLNINDISNIYNIGNLSSDALKSAVFDAKYQLIPIKIERLIKDAENEFIKNEDLQLLDTFLDNGYYEILFNYLEDINEPYLFYFYKKEVDLLNIIIACRSKVRDLKKGKLAEILIKYGNLSVQKFINIYETSLSSWPNHFQRNEYEHIVENGIKYWLEDNSLLEIDKLADNYLLNLLKVGKYNTFGLESVIAYYYAKENDIKNIRMISNYKRYSLSKELLKENVRDTYV